MMYKNFTEQARNILARAEQEARQFDHEYVGTEHLLWAIVGEDSGLAVEALHSFGVRADDVRSEIAKLVQRGDHPVSRKVLPLTPRAKQAIAFAGEEARYWSQKQVGAEHLLLGLVREPDGVAGQVLRNLGLKPKELLHEVLKTRIVQMRIVERAVRPVRAGTPRKRKMREELLGHVSAIYDQELARLHNPDAALEAAARRFGDPAELARELDAALPYHERINHFVERSFAWRAPETAARYSLRLAIQLFCVLAVVFGVVGVGEVFRFGWVEEVRLLWRVFAAVLLVALLAQFLVGVLYFKMRDAMWGVFGSRKSAVKVFVYDALIALTISGASFGTAAVTWGKGRMAIELLYVWSAAGFVAAIGCLLLARFRGPAEIRDAVWALLEVGGAKAVVSFPPHDGDSAVEPA